MAPFYDQLVRQFQLFDVFHKNLSIDEEMVPYHGHHSSKMLIRNKPIRFGFKLWMLCSVDGYPYKVQIYCGKDNDDKSPLGTRVVGQLLACVDDPSSHVVFFDNFFSSYHRQVSQKRAFGRPVQSVKIALDIALWSPVEVERSKSTNLLTTGQMDKWSA